MDSLDILQTPFIDNLIQNKSFVSIYLRNSIRLKGHLISQDEKMVFLRNGGIQMVCKTAISTISPEMTFETYQV